MSNWIEQLRALNTSCLSDALDSLGISGGLEGIQSQSTNSDLCGRAFTVKFVNPSEEDRVLAKAADYIDETKEGDVVVLANNGRTDCTVWGGILTTLAQMKQLSGTVIDGACRDKDEICHMGYPIFTKSVFMQTGKSRTQKIAHQVPVRISGIMVNLGDYIRGDANGIVVIPETVVGETVKRARAIEETEEKIKRAISNGVPLMEARKQYKYHRPWEVCQEVN